MTAQFAGYKVDGNGQWTNCWGKDRKHFNPHWEKQCEETATYCVANPGQCK